MSGMLSFAHMLHNIRMKVATSMPKRMKFPSVHKWSSSVYCTPCTPICQHLGFLFHFVEIGVFFGFFYGLQNKGSIKQYIDWHALWLGARLSWSGCCVLNARSLLLCLHPKPSFEMHVAFVILNPQFADL